MSELSIRPVDPHDDADFSAAYAVLERAQRHGRPHALLEAAPAMQATLREPTSSTVTELLVGESGGDTVGVVLLERNLGEENAHVAGIEVSVSPEHRRRGHGRALAADAVRRAAAAGCTTGLCEVHEPVGSTATGGLAFAQAMGWSPLHDEEHLVLRLPADPPRPSPDPAHEVITWVGACPEEHLAAYCEMRTRMDAEVPLGDVDWTPTVRTPERQRESEARMVESYTTVVSAARSTADGALVGYSQMFLPHDSDIVWQDDTLVMPDHRGHRLGLALKHATLDVVRRDHPERSVIHTWTDPENTAMRATNAEFGFEVAERMFEVQGVLASAPPASEASQAR